MDGSIEKAGRNGIFNGEGGEYIGSSLNHTLWCFLTVFHRKSYVKKEFDSSNFLFIRSNVYKIYTYFILKTMVGLLFTCPH